MALAGLEYTTIKEISGPLLFVESVRGVGYGELARIRTPSGEERRGQVLEIGGGVAVVQVFEGTTGLDVGKTRVRFTGETVKLPVSNDMLGRIFDGSGRPIDGGPRIIPDDYLDVNGNPINPFICRHGNHSGRASILQRRFREARSIRPRDHVCQPCG